MTSSSRRGNCDGRQIHWNRSAGCPAEGTLWERNLRSLILYLQLPQCFDAFIVVFCVCDTTSTGKSDILVSLKYGISSIRKYFIDPTEKLGNKDLNHVLSLIGSMGLRPHTSRSSKVEASLDKMEWRERRGHWWVWYKGTSKLFQFCILLVSSSAFEYWFPVAYIRVLQRILGSSLCSLMQWVISIAGVCPLSPSTVPLLQFKPS